MSGAIGKGATSLKKDTSKESLVPQVGFKNLQFMHSASAGDTAINLQALNTPALATANGFLQPSASDLAATNILQFKQNVELKSSLRNMVQFIDYVISGPQLIKLVVPAEEGEIFTGTINAAPRSGVTLLDASATPVTGMLAAGQTDFSTGPYEVGKNPSAQHGAFMVLVDGQLAYRNFGNQSDGEGDYYELAGLIRFNTTDTEDRNISLIPIGAIVEKPDGSQLAMVEALNSKIDSIIPTVADLAGVDESTFGVTPSNLDLKAFGDRVLSIEQALETKEDEFSIPTQTKILSGNITATDLDIVEMKWNNLEIGKTYRLTLSGRFVFQGNNSSELRYIHDGNPIIRLESNGTGGTSSGVGVQHLSNSVVFTATEDTITLQTAGTITANDRIEGNGTLAETYSQLEELPNHETTTKWT